MRGNKVSASEAKRWLGMRGVPGFAAHKGKCKKCGVSANFRKVYTTGTLIGDCTHEFAKKGKK